MEIIFSDADHETITYEKFLKHLKRKRKGILEHEGFPNITSIVIPGLITILLEVIKLFF